MRSFQTGWTAEIIPFPSSGARRTSGNRPAFHATLRSDPAVVETDGWYHAAAVEDERLGVGKPH